MEIKYKGEVIWTCDALMRIPQSIIDVINAAIDAKGVMDSLWTIDGHPIARIENIRPDDSGFSIGEVIADIKKANKS